MIVFVKATRPLFGSSVCFFGGNPCPRNLPVEWKVSERDLSISKKGWVNCCAKVPRYGRSCVISGQTRSRKPHEKSCSPHKLSRPERFA